MRIRNNNSFQGRSALVTGAGSGIGRALAADLSRRGVALHLADIDAEGLEATIRSIGANPTVTRHLVDVSSREQMAALGAQFDSLDILINNAGITSLAPFASHDLDDFERILDINIRGTIYGCKYLLPALRADGGGHIVNMSSIAGYTGMPHQSAYCASKFAIRGFSASIRSELARDNVSVMCVHPGVVRTNIIASANAHDNTARDKLARLLERHIVSPEHVAHRIVSALHRDVAELRVTAESYLLDWSHRAAPGLTRRLMQFINDRFDDI